MAFDVHLSGKTAVISGSTAGIGFATAAALAGLGARVVITGRTAERVDSAVAALRAAGGEVIGVAGDLVTAAGVEHLVRAVPDADILINSLGIFAPQPFEEISDEDWLRFIETNVLSGVRLTRAYLHGMRERNWGRAIFVSSESGLQIQLEMIHYA